MEIENFDQFENNMNIINKQIDEGCGNPYCEIFHCKSCKEHMIFDNDEDRSDYVISTATDGVSDCVKFINPKTFKLIDYQTFPIEEYLSNDSLSFSFINFEENHRNKSNEEMKDNEMKDNSENEYILENEKKDYDCMFEFFENVGKNEYLLKRLIAYVNKANNFNCNNNNSSMNTINGIMILKQTRLLNQRLNCIISIVKQRKHQLYQH